MSGWNVVWIIALALGFIVSNIMALRYLGRFNISPELQKKIAANNRRADELLKEQQDEIHSPNGGTQ